MVASTARYALYAGGLIALWLSTRRRKRAEVEVLSAGTGKAKVGNFLSTTRALQSALRRALLQPAEAVDEASPAELARLCQRFRSAVSAEFRPSSFMSDPRAVHYVRKLRDALPQATPPGAGTPDAAATAPDPFDASLPEARRRLHAAHEASLELIEFLQIELGLPHGARLDVGDLGIDPSRIGL